MPSTDPLADEDTNLKNRFNDELSATFPMRNDYSHVHVLLIFWEECDIPDGKRTFQDEAIDLESLFQEQFLYDVSRFAIPSDESQLALEGAIINFILKRDCNSLLLIHYGGHGDPDDSTDEHRRQAVWASARCDGPTIDWFKIQPRLNNIKSDVVLIIDACFSAQAARDRALISNRIELLAACPMGQLTHEPGPTSFTTALIKQLKSSLSLQGHAVVSEVHNALMKSTSRLHETAVYGVLQSGCGRPIKLEPLLAKPECRLDIASSLVFRVSTSSRIDNRDVFDQVLNWLRKHAPRVVTNMSVEQVCHTTRSMLEFVQQEPSKSSPNPLFQQLAPEAQREAMLLCDELIIHLTSGSVFSNISATDMQTLNNHEEHGRNFVCTLLEKVNNLRSSLERNIVASCIDRGSISQVLEDDGLQELGFRDTLRMKEISIGRSSTEESLTLGPTSTARQVILADYRVPFEVRNVPDLSQVFVEYKYYEKKDKNKVTMETSKALVSKLAEVLQESKSEEFHSMDCQKWFLEPDYDRFALVFKIPPPSSRTYKTLYQAITCRTRFRPTLEERFMLASKIGHAIRKWHLAGWVHQGISSRNIIFWCNDLGEVDYTRPYLCGFEYSRPSAHPSYPRYVDNLAFDVYRHPDRQGVPSIQHRKEHDLYSFGVLLLEVGLWQLAADFFEKNKDFSPAIVKEELCKNAKGRLGHYMGINYRAATAKCMGGFDVKEDDLAGSKLSKAFEILVLRRITRGIHVI